MRLVTIIGTDTGALIPVFYALHEQVTEHVLLADSAVCAGSSFLLFSHLFHTRQTPLTPPTFIQHSHLPRVPHLPQQVSGNGAQFF
jgi:hypothetical protein